MPLEFRDPPKVPFLNIMLYGPPKIGKTSGALTAPGPILYLNAEGLNAAMYARRHAPEGHILEAPIRSNDTLLDAISYLNENGPATVVLDSVDAAFRALLEDLSKEGKRTLPMYGDVTTMIERFCLHMCDLPVNFVVIAHEQSIKDDESGGFERLPYTGTNNPALGIKILERVDVIGYCGRTSPENGEPQYVAQLFNGGGRRGGDRTDLLGENRELDLSEWIDTYTRALEPATNRKAKVAA